MPSASSPQRNHQVGVGLSRRSVGVPTPTLHEAVWEGCFSLVGGFSHSAVLFDKQPEKRNVRPQPLRSLDAKAQAVAGAGDVGYEV